jgi:hypothetical protein
MTTSIRTIFAVTALAIASVNVLADTAQTPLDELYSDALSALHSQSDSSETVLSVEKEGRQLSVVLPANISSNEIAHLIEREAYGLRLSL